MEVDPARTHTFTTAADFGRWLATHHAEQGEVWVKVHKANSGTASVTWGQAIIEALAWGWIDGIKKSNDAVSWFQRFTPRTPRSHWSKVNRAHARRLIAEGSMQPAGLAAVVAAEADGRWEAAYAGSADMVFPDGLLHAIAADATAQAAFDRLGRTALYPIFHRLQTAKRQTTRLAIMAAMLDRLSRGEPPGGQTCAITRSMHNSVPAT